MVSYFVFRVFPLSLLLFGCQYQCNQLLRETGIQNDLVCVWDVKPYTYPLMHSLRMM